MHHSSSLSQHPIHHTSGSDPVLVNGVPVQRSSGRGCVFTMVLIPLFIVGVVGAIIFFAFQGVNNTVRSVNASIAQSGGSTTSLGQDPTVVADLAIMHAALDKRIPGWEAQKDNVVHHVSVADAGLPNNFNTKEVVYGYCGASQFYLFVLNSSAPEDTSADTEGYEYVPSSSPVQCAPVGWQIMSSDTAASDWYFITADTKAATATPKGSAQ